MFASDYHFFGSMKEGLRVKHYSSNKEVKYVVNEWLKEQSTEYYGQGYMLSFEGGTLLLRETVTMWKSRDVIHRGPDSF